MAETILKKKETFKDKVNKTCEKAKTFFKDHKEQIVGAAVMAEVVVLSYATTKLGYTVGYRDGRIAELCWMVDNGLTLPKDN